MLTTKVIGSSSSQWFGYINLTTPDDVQKCINALHQTELHGKKIYVDRVREATHLLDEFSMGFGLFRRCMINHLDHHHRNLNRIVVPFHRLIQIEIVLIINHLQSIRIKIGIRSMIVRRNRRRLMDNRLRINDQHRLRLKTRRNSPHLMGNHRRMIKEKIHRVINQRTIEILVQILKDQVFEKKDQ